MPEIDNHRYHLLTIMLCLCDIRLFNGIHMYTMLDNTGSLKTKSDFFNVSACRFVFLSLNLIYHPWSHPYTFTCCLILNSLNSFFLCLLSVCNFFNTLELSHHTLMLL